MKLTIKNVLTVCVLSGSPMMTFAATDATYNPSQDARIRLYGQNQKPTIMEYQLDGKKQKINVGGQAGDAFSSFLGTVKNTSLGIAPTETSQNLKQYNGVLSKVFYKELIIPTNTPISVRNAFLGLSQTLKTPTQTTVRYEGSCDAKALSFVAQAGKDYEAIPAHNSAACGVILLEVDANGQTKHVNFSH